LYLHDTSLILLPESLSPVLVAGTMLPHWFDEFISILSAIGFLLTAIGVAFAWVQLKRTQKSAEAAADAARNAAIESRSRYNKFTVNQSLRFISEIETYADIAQWKLAVLRLGDLSQAMNQTEPLTEDWNKLVESIDRMRNSFRRIEDGETKYTPNLKTKTRNLLKRVETALIKQAAPFPNEVDEDDPSHDG